MLKSAKGKEDDLLAMEFYQLGEQTIHKSCATLEVLQYGAENVSATKRRHFQVCLNGVWQAPMT